MNKLAFFMTTKNSEKSTGAPALLFALRWKNWEYLFSQNYVEICLLGNVHMLKTFPQSDLKYVSSLQRYGPDIISGPFFSKSSK